ncbi:membrane dipeptidase [Pseudohyphozyma bogoriensis]|nr:membrane dipeptidase [Pseudohyphozyma bogoriensis]
MHFSPLVFTLLSSALAASVKPEAAYYTQAARILKENPLIDGHVDLPFVMRHLAKKPMEVIKDLSGSLPGHVDIPRMKEGGVGGVFNVAYAPCNSEPTGKDFLLPTNSAEYALESVDLINQLVAAHPEDLAMAYTAADVRANFKAGKISSLIGLEGSHHLMNSLSILRTFYSLGVRYVTLTHTCHNSFASSAGDGSDIKPVHRGNGLTALGREMIYEMNRLGMMIDLSHVSDQTMTESIKLSVAPVIFSHSGARAIHEHPRNVPDSVLELIGSGPGKNNGVVMAVFYPAFVGKEGEQNVEKVADHIEHLAKICGKAHVGLGSDFDGMHSSVEGLEDTSKFPNIVAELLGRGWTESEMVGLIGGNVLRVMDAVDDVRKDFEAKKNAPATGVYDKRKDAPVQWGGPGGSYLPDDVKVAASKLWGRAKDEL